MKDTEQSQVVNVPSKPLAGSAEMLAADLHFHTDLHVSLPPDIDPLFFFAFVLVHCRRFLLRSNESVLHFQYAEGGKKQYFKLQLNHYLSHPVQRCFVCVESVTQCSFLSGWRKRKRKRRLWGAGTCLQTVFVWELKVRPPSAQTKPGTIVKPPHPQSIQPSWLIDAGLVSCSRGRLFVTLRGVQRIWKHVWKHVPVREE